jgi:glutamate N-acetyltransferase / amino-acid N-acetyltransferase
MRGLAVGEHPDVGGDAGVAKRVRIEMAGAASAAAARQVARSIAESELVKTALYGGDPNWGRIVAAAGYAGRGDDQRSDPAYVRFNSVYST